MIDQKNPNHYFDYYRSSSWMFYRIGYKRDNLLSLVEIVRLVKKSEGQTKIETINLNSSFADPVEPILLVAHPPCVEGVLDAVSLGGGVGFYWILPKQSFYKIDQSTGYPSNQRQTMINRSEQPDLWYSYWQQTSSGNYYRTVQTTNSEVIELIQIVHHKGEYQIYDNFGQVGKTLSSLQTTLGLLPFPRSRMIDQMKSGTVRLMK